ncbi:putative clathrin assembly protein-like isoform X1 [Capsicum annuum]|nr:putative clathrin assembly protein-like isoform X1 [Capsicum annuum]
MSSWFSLPLLNPFKSNDDDGAAAATATAVYDGGKPSDSDPNFSSIKEDFSAISQTFTHHLRGVASFLTPPSPPPPSTQSEQQSEKFIGIKSDLVEIGDSLKSSVSEISKLASNLLHFGDNEVNDREKNEYDDEEEEEEEEEEIVGVTDDVVDFVSTISQRDQLWTDFPISLPSDFSMSDSQKEHVASIVQFVPGLESLRQKVVEVRETLLQQLQSKKDSQPEASKDSETVDASEKDVEISGQQVSESKLEEKNISETANASQDKDSLHGEKRQEPLDEEKTKNTTSYADKNEDDVSFSDLEDDDTDLSDRLQGSKPPHRKKVSSSSESHEWIQLNENSKAQGSQQKAGQSIHRDKDSEGDESSDWLTVDDIDSDSLATN